MLSRGQRHISPQGARLHWKRRPRTPRAVVLVLHGGQAHGTQPTSLTQASVLRVMPFVRAIARRGGDGVAVGFLRYAVRGWNSGGDALRDARWALSQIEAAYPDLPLGVVGYSMGGRVALYLAGECRPRAVVGLAARVLRAPARASKSTSCRETPTLSCGTPATGTDVPRIS